MTTTQKEKYQRAIDKGTGKYDISEIVTSAVSSNKEARKEIDRVLKAANSRIRNLKKKGLADYSGALKQLESEGWLKMDNKFNYLSTRASNWDRTVTIYTKALAFLKSETSLVQGVKKRQIELQEDYNLPPEIQKKVLSKIFNEDLAERAANGNYKYKEFLERFARDSMIEDYDTLSNNENEISNKIVNRLNNLQSQLSKAVTNFEQEAEDIEALWNYQVPDGGTDERTLTVKKVFPDFNIDF